MSTSNNIKVAIKVRPLISRERKAHVAEQWTVEGNSIVCLNPLPTTTTTTYYFDHVFGKESRNRDVFDKIAHPVIRQSLEGFNGTIFAYGQTSSGKTHTMIGSQDDPGITVLAVRQLFEEIESDRVFMIRAGYIEIYNEKVYDLLNDRELVKINQNGDNDIKLTNKETCVTDGEMILKMLNRGNKLRKAAQTNMNETSSRSHAIFRIIIESEDATGKGPVQVSYLNLVDLAGSEKTNDALTSGLRLQEGKDINTSLLHLGMAIRALSEGKKFVDFRSSKLTRILQASLGGNANTAIVCNVTPAALEETASTLNFANQAKTVKNDAKCNKVFSPDEALMKQLQAEIIHLKAELAKSQQSKESEKKLEADIARKEEIFLTGRNIRVKADRRQTWHHMPGDNNKIVAISNTTTNGDSPTVDISPCLPDTPRELRHQPPITPSPTQATLKYQLYRVEKELSDLQQFTALESNFGCQRHFDFESFEKRLTKNTKSHEMIASPLEADLVESSNSSVLNELSEVKMRNTELLQQVAELHATYEEKIQTAEKKQEKAEILQAEIEITFDQYKKQANQRINELETKLESMKDQSVLKPLDLNISQMPIKVEPKISSELAELMYENDQLKLDQKRNLETIENLKSQLEVISNEKSRIQRELSESAINKETVERLTTQLYKMNEERNILQSEHSEVSSQNSKIIEDLECKLRTVTKERNTSINQLELQLKTIVDERNVLETKYLEESTANLNVIKDLQSQLKTLSEEKSVLETEHSEMSTQIMEYIEELDQIKIELENLQRMYDASCAEVDRLQSIVDDNLLVILKTEEECKTFRASLVESYDKIKISMQETEYLKKREQSLCEEIVNLKNFLNVQSTEIGSLNDKIKELEQLNTTLWVERENDDSLKQIEELKAKHNTEIAVMEKDMDSLRQIFESSSNKLQDCITQLQSELKEKQEQLNSLKNDLNIRELKLEDYQKEIAKYEVIISDAKAESDQKFQSHIKRLETQLELKQQEIDKCEAMICEQKSTSSNLEASVIRLQTELTDKEQQLNKLQNDLKIRQITLEEHQQEITNYEGIITDLKTEYDRKLEAQMKEFEEKLLKKQEEIDNYETMISDQKIELNEEFQKKLLGLKIEWQESKEQHLSEFKAKISEEFEERLSKLKMKAQKQEEEADAIIAELRKQLSDSKVELQEMQHQVNIKMEMIADLKSQLEPQEQSEKIISDLKRKLLDLKAQLQERQLKVDENEAIVADNTKTKEEFLNQLSELKTKLQKKQRQINEYDAKISAQNENFQKELLKLTSKLQEMQEDVVRNETIIQNLKSDLYEKEKRALSTKNIIDSLENKLRAHDERKKSPTKGTKSNLSSDRKYRRHSQHDESRMWLDDSVVPPTSVAIQTDPTDANCNCESMNQQIKELTRTIAIKNSVINAERLEMRNHPLIGENSDLKRKLQQQQAEAHLLRLDIEHYKEKAHKHRQCFCVPKKMESKEIQADCDSNFFIEKNNLNSKIGDDLNIPNVENGYDNNASYCYHCVNVLTPQLDQAKEEVKELKLAKNVVDEKIKKLKTENSKISAKTRFYRDLAVSRRNQIKKIATEQSVHGASAEL